ncbi:MAG: S46 family peptidase [Saprospirales bacterium]|nr:MAG: S46 family peptidase [Saprospirales bacterium]
MKLNYSLILTFVWILFFTYSCSTGQQLIEPESVPHELAQPSLLPEFEAVESSIFDNGRMWTFEYAPVDYFAETYNFDPDDTWFERARLAALRLPGCSASFVSGNGLVMTNHHCARNQITQIGLEGERTLDDGFYAETLEDERKIEDYYIDQLIEIRDVSDLILAEVDAVPMEEQAEIRREVIRRVQSKITEELDNKELIVQVRSLFNGGRYSAYIFRRFTDIRMVMAPELQLGYFGGDTDNFSYPRYALDMTFFRIYVDDEPYQSEHYFPFSKKGVEEGDAVFMIGNPGRTTRLNTVAQLSYTGEFNLEFRTSSISSTIRGLERFYENDPTTEEAQRVRNMIFGWKNGEKLFNGQKLAHRDPYLMGRKVDNENNFIKALKKDEQLKSTYLPVIERISEIQEEKARLAPYSYISSGISPNSGSSASVLQRGYVAYLMNQEGISEERKEELLEALGNIRDKDPILDRELIQAHLEYLTEILGEDNIYIKQLLGDKNPAKVSKNLLEKSAFTSAESTTDLIENDKLDFSDPAVEFFQTFGNKLADANSAYRNLGSEERNLQNVLGRGWFAVYDTSIPPDATFSLRIADGVAAGYVYNGTRAPAYTTFYGMYDRHYSHKDLPEFDLPKLWKNPPEAFDLSSPVNFVSTNDIIGGNSGSPTVNINLEVVGLAFDGNVESMGSSTFILDERSARAVSVDSRGMLEALRNVYGAERLVRELENARAD